MNDRKGTGSDAAASGDGTETGKPAVALPIQGFGDIAALLVLMTRNLSASGAAHTSFDEQLTHSTGLLPDSDVFTRALQVASFLHARRPERFADLHNAVRALLEDMEQTVTDQGVRWSVCAFISQNQIKRIARL